jgi:membrane protease YdiL (CAAX protease family)
VDEASALPKVPKQRRQLPEHLRVPWGFWAGLLFPVVWFAAQVLIVLLLVFVAQWVPSLKGFMDAVRAEDVVASFVLSVASAFIGLGLLMLYLRRYHTGWKTLGWRRAGVLKSVLYIVLIIIVFLILFQIALALADKLIPGFDPNQAQNNEFTKNAGSHRSISLIALVMIPPIIEESIFRGFMFPAFSKKLGLVGGAILSSVIFGLFHGQANIFIYTTILGLFLSFMYVRLKSIYPGMVLHMLNNLLAFWAILSR